ncbi:MAG: pyrroline-5-carboxylate reductase [Actinobacteria bacterium]|nr:pyrroline-5-carboxylate reductase [Actinomycetota bacterium]
MSNEIADKVGRLLIVGGGKMGEAILAGLVATEGFDPRNIMVSDPSEERCAHLSQVYGIPCVDDPIGVLPVDTLVFAVKPQVIRPVVESFAREDAIAGTLVITIAAGVTCKTLEDILPATCPVVRVMPNTPLVSGCGMSTISSGNRCTEEDVELVRGIFATMGEAIVLPEESQDASCALNGSGPAYFSLFVDILARAGEKHGLSYEVAKMLALQTMLGTARMLVETGQAPETVIKAVSSPGGTTIAALEAFAAHGLESALFAGVDAAVSRSKELS